MEDFVDKNAIMQVFGCILQDSLLLSDTKFKLDVVDFPDLFTRSIYAAMNNLFLNGAQKISIIDIDKYLSNNTNLYEDFIKKNGIQYLNDAEELAQLDNYKYYYNRVKKFSALRSLYKKGFNVYEIYNPKLLGTSDFKKMEEKFEEMSLVDIFNYFSHKLLDLESKYNASENKGSIKATEGITSLKEKLKKSPEVGYSFQNEIYNTIVRGARKGKFYLNSGSTGSGKSRFMVGAACNLAYPYRYNSRTKIWEEVGNKQKVLVITTELEEDEVQTMILAYLTDINEEIILNSTYTKEEESRIDKAIEIMETYDNLYIERLSDPSVSQITSCIKKHCVIYGVDHVFYDYIFSSPGLLNEYRDLKIREDVSLKMLSTALKDIAVDYNIFIMSGTQLNSDWETKKGIRNQNLISGSKAIAEKIDIGSITLPVTKEEINMLTPYINSLGIKPPTHVTDIYKVRRGRYNEVRIWSNFDLGTCRMVDLFITDAYFNPIRDFNIVKYVIGNNENKPSINDSIEKSSIEEKEKNNEDFHFSF